MSPPTLHPPAGVPAAPWGVPHPGACIHIRLCAGRPPPFCAHPVSSGPTGRHHTRGSAPPPPSAAYLGRPCFIVHGAEAGLDDSFHGRVSEENGGTASPAPQGALCSSPASGCHSPSFRGRAQDAAASVAHELRASVGNPIPCRGGSGWQSDGDRGGAGAQVLPVRSDGEAAPDAVSEGGRRSRGAGGFIKCHGHGSMRHIAGDGLSPAESTSQGWWVALGLRPVTGRSGQAKVDGGWLGSSGGFLAVRSRKGRKEFWTGGARYEPGGWTRKPPQGALMAPLRPRCWSEQIVWPCLPRKGPFLWTAGGITRSSRPVF